MYSESRRVGSTRPLQNILSWLISQICEPDRPAAPTIPSANQVVHDAHRGSRTPLTLPKPTRQTSTSSGLHRIFSSLFGSSSSSSSQPVNPNVFNRRPPSPKDNLRRNTKGFRKTENWRPTEGPEAGKACRVYGSVGVKRVTGNLHVTTLGHGYMSWEHTGHDRQYRALSLPLPLHLGRSSEVRKIERLTFDVAQ